MRPKASESEGHQLELGAVLLESFIKMKDDYSSGESHRLETF